MEYKCPIRISSSELDSQSDTSSESSEREVIKKLLADKVRVVVDSVTTSGLECKDHNLKASIKAFSGEDPDPKALVLIFNVCCKKMGRDLGAHVESL